MAQPEIVASPQQREVYQWIRHGQGNAIVVAVAGAGKTTTLINALKYTKGPTAFAAFNKKIADEIKERTSDQPHVTAGTFHSFGNRAWRAVAPGARLDNNKVYKIMDDALTPKALKPFVKRAIGMAKQSGFGVEGCPNVHDDIAWNLMADHFDLWDDLPSYASESEAIAECVRILSICAQLSTSQRVIDFDDMIWLPLLHNVRIPQYSWVMVDEAQDSNVMRRIFAERMMHPEARLVAVGDPHQAIYGFSGAMSDSLDEFRTRLNCTELPLTVTFRCPKAVVEIAQQWVSHITAADSAPDGLYINYTYNTQPNRPQHLYMTDMIDNPDDRARYLTPSPDTQVAVLCRNTAPLVNLAYRLIAEMIPCHVEGRDIGQGLIKLIKKFDRYERATDMMRAVNEYAKERIAEWEELGKSYKAAALEDKIDTLQIIVDNPAIGPLTSDVISAINSLFADTDDNGRRRNDITLCTIHRSKGREWDRVIWLGRAQLQPSKWAVKRAAATDGEESWQLEQEYNLMYVAATRAKNELIEVDLNLD